VTVVCCVLVATSLISQQIIAGSQIIKVPEDYPAIQLAIDAANTGDTIQVASGTYFGKVRVTKSLRLIGEGPENTVITPEAANGTAIVTVVKVLADNVEIRGFTIRGGTTGVLLQFSSGTLLRNNVMSDNKRNFGVLGDSLSHFAHDVDSSNMVDGKPICFWLNSHGRQVPTEAGYVAIVNSTKITVKDVELTSNWQGVLLVNTRHSLVENVTALGNDEGIVLRMSNENTILMNHLVAVNLHAIYCLSSYNNTFTENTISNATRGVVMQHSNGNTIYHNNFINNQEQLRQLNSSNIWDNGKEGNYWSNYQGEDMDGDGIGDTSKPHLGVDHYPLIDLFDETPPKADAGTNQTVMKDVPAVFDASSSWDNIDIIAYEWSFGDGSNCAGVTPSHVYHTAGVYTVTLTVTDVAGKASTDTIIVSVVDLHEFPPRWVLFVAIAGMAIILVIVIRLRSSPKKENACRFVNALNEADRIQITKAQHVFLAVFCVESSQS